MFRFYKRRGFVELRPYIPGEDLSGVSVSCRDTPCAGDMIARNPENHADQWLVAEDYFKEHYEIGVLITPVELAALRWYHLCYEPLLTEEPQAVHGASKRLADEVRSLFCLAGVADGIPE